MDNKLLVLMAARACDNKKARSELSQQEGSNKSVSSENVYGQ